ncbi:hypothetical protein [Solimonas sp. SE-A11]|uniref:hypothetical protein n=1 Tax=Solimonas sp. SE-A11 TaxID=3054954 RepID=UPI00259CA8B4|nr:hypothetical protein [Solimonas sp. SE-A11]MDM4768663.1 hypothetical protein [Solimonas sp. SE-A11]
MPRYQVLRELLRFNGKEFGENSTVEMEQSQADPLLTLGALAPLSEDAPKASKKAAKDDPSPSSARGAGAAAANAAAAAPADGQGSSEQGPNNPESPKQEAPGEAPAIVPAPTQTAAAPKGKKADTKAKAKKADAKTKAK